MIRCAESAVTLDSWGNVIQKTVLHSVTFEYDKEGALVKKHLLPAGGEPQTITIEKTDGDSSILKFKAGAQDVVAHAKTDTFGRKEFDELQLGAGFVSRQFDYHVGQVTQEHREGKKLKSSPTTQLVSRITFSDGRTIAYEYDAEERITKVTDSVDGITEYTYDALGQLLTETVNGVVKNTMTYDNYGNILSKNGKTYSYDNVVWGDLLTSYHIDPIFYDAQGNPVIYRNHDLCWEKGRQLKSFDNVHFAYNANGIRTSKTVVDVEHTYTLEGAKILREKWGANELIPLYDGSEEVCGIVYNGNPFYFQKNLQGDIIAIINKDAETVARYSYDAWGVCTVKSDTSDCNIATINPFRYRGYYYDAEIGLYYLQSRYYDPNVARFVNGDFPDIISTVNVKHTTNLYCYCSNDPTNETDAYGNLIASAIAKFVIYAVFGVFVQFASDIIEFLLRKFIKKKNVSFSLSPLGDYLGSALSWGMCSLNLFNNKLVAFLVPFVPVLVKHLTNIIRGSFSWYALLVDVAAAFVAGIISVALNKSMKNKLSQVKRGKGNRYSDYSKYLKKQQRIVIKINKSFLKASLTIVIATTLMQLLLNLLLK